MSDVGVLGAVVDTFSQPKRNGHPVTHRYGGLTLVELARKAGDDPLVLCEDCGTAGILRQGGSGLGYATNGDAEVTQFWIGCPKCEGKALVLNGAVRQAEGVTSMLLGVPKSRLDEAHATLRTLLASAHDLTSEEIAGQIDEGMPWLSSLASWIRSNPDKAVPILISILSLVVALTNMVLTQSADDAPPQLAPEQLEELLVDVLDGVHAKELPKDPLLQPSQPGEIPRFWQDQLPARGTAAQPPLGAE